MKTPFSIPEGTWFQRNGNTIVVGASNRSVTIIVQLVINLVLTLLFFNFLYTRLFENSEGASNYTLLVFGFIWLLLILRMIPIVFGKVELTLQPKGGQVFTGVGK